MSLTPKEQADIDAETIEYETRQERMREERKAARYTREHAAWRRKLATAGVDVMSIEHGTQARRLLVDGHWCEGKWTLVARPAELTRRATMWWVDEWTRGVVPLDNVQGWQYPQGESGADEPAGFAAMRVLRGQEPRPDCGGSLDVWQVQSEVGDTGVVEDIDGTLRTASTASDEAYCHECEHMIPLAATRDPEKGDVLVLVEHDRAGRTLI